MNFERTLPIVPGCRAILLACMQPEGVGAEVICHYKCPEVIKRVYLDDQLWLMKGPVWYITLIGGKLQGYAQEIHLMRLDGYGEAFTNELEDLERENRSPQRSRKEER